MPSIPVTSGISHSSMQFQRTSYVAKDNFRACMRIRGAKHVHLSVTMKEMWEIESKLKFLGISPRIVEAG